MEKVDVIPNYNRRDWQAHANYGAMREAERGYAESTFKQLVSVKVQGIGATRAALGRVLRSVDFVGWSRREETGRLDKRSLSRFAVGDGTLFSRRTSKEATKSAVTVLVDCSGSMSGSMEITAQVATQLGLLLEQSRVSLNIVGFTGSEPRDNYDRDLGTNVQELVLVPFKPRGRSLRQCAKEMGMMPSCAIGGNPDYAAIMYGIEELAAQPEQRKVLFFLTDTGSYIESHMAHAAKMAEKLGITMIAIGIQTRDVKKLFKHAVDVSDIHDLGKHTFNILLKTIKPKKVEST